MLGQELKRARVDAGLTQEALADGAGVHRTYVSLLERNRKSPTVAMLFRLCEVLSVRPSTLLSRVEARQTERRR